MRSGGSFLFVPKCSSLFSKSVGIRPLSRFVFSLWESYSTPTCSQDESQKDVKLVGKSPCSSRAFSVALFEQELNTFFRKEEVITYLLSSAVGSQGLQQRFSSGMPQLVQLGLRSLLKQTLSIRETAACASTRRSVRFLSPVRGVSWPLEWGRAGRLWEVLT